MCSQSSKQDDTRSSYESIYEQLQRTFYVRNDETHDFAPCVSDHHMEGVVTPLFTNRDEAEQLASQMMEVMEVSASVKAVSSLWDFLQDCALRGFAGVMVDMKHPIQFYNRLYDFDRRLPTVMKFTPKNMEAGSSPFFFSRLGLAEPKLETISPWSDLSRFDKKSNMYQLCGSPLPEGIDAHAIYATGGNLHTFRDGATFLGPYVSTNGAVPIFSDRVWAEYFAELHFILPDKQKGDDQIELEERLVLSRVSLNEFLDYIDDEFGRMSIDIGLNPGCHRFRQGCFFKKDESWFLQTVSGVWELDGAELHESPNVMPPKGSLYDTVQMDATLSNVTSCVKFPFRRLLGASQALMTDDDAQELLAAELCKGVDPKPPEGDLLPRDDFMITAFDKISGDSYEYWLAHELENPPPIPALLFPDIIAAATYLVEKILPQDEEIRIHGAALCNGVVESGSDAPERERDVTNAIEDAIHKVLVDSLANGYKPSHSYHLKKLMCDISKTFEIKEIGYVSDILFHGLSDGSDLWELIDDDLFEVKAKHNRLIQRYTGIKSNLAKDQRLPINRESQLRASLEATYDLAEPETLIISSSALDEFERVGRRQAYDYSGITMKLAKTVERELVHRLFVNWRWVVRQDLKKAGIKKLREELNDSKADITSLRLLDWLEKRGKLDLGAIRYVFEAIKTKENLSSVLANLSEFMESLRDYTWLLSDELTAVLEEISTRYRNGGVHEHLVDFETCEEALQRICIGEGPILKRVLEATELVGVE